MSLGALAVVAEWLDAVNRGDGPRVERLSAADVEVAGPRGSVRGRQVLSAWLARAGFSAEARRWFCGADGTVVVEQDALWVDPLSSAPRGRAAVASRFLVRGGHVARYARHDDLAAALAAAGLHERDEVLAPATR
jgi:ketosteroid isomerase-like protein